MVADTNIFHKMDYYSSLCLAMLMESATKLNTLQYVAVSAFSLVVYVSRWFSQCSTNTK